MSFGLQLCTHVLVLGVHKLCRWDVRLYVRSPKALDTVECSIILKQNSTGTFGRHGD